MITHSVYNIDDYYIVTLTQSLAELKMWTRVHFRKIYIPEGFSVTKIRFEDKKGGDQEGICMVIQYETKNENEYTQFLYHLKTHERGISRSNKVSYIKRQLLYQQSKIQYLTHFEN